jgi:non-ribosomal peptide synthetase component F
VNALVAPDAVALEMGHLSLTYAELEARSNRLAHHLLAQGIGQGSTLGVCLPRSFELIIAILATWKSGAVYLPLDPSYPRDRLLFMVEESATALVLTDSSVAGLLRGSSAPLLVWDEEQPVIDGRPSSVTGVTVEAGDLAYVMYTSGSTGQPKGAMIEHRGLSNVAHAQMAMFESGCRTRVLQFASMSFDASIFEVVLALRAGGTLCLAPREFLLPGPGLVRVLQEHAVTTVVLPPSVLLHLDPDDCPSLRVVTVAGEACPPELPARWGRNCRFFNLYGPSGVSQSCSASGRVGERVEQDIGHFPVVPR